MPSRRRGSRRDCAGWEPASDLDSRAQAINNRGWVAGFSHLSDGSRRAVLWPDHQTVISLGTLGGPHSSVVRNGLSNGGVVVGLSHSTEVDPLNEVWSCEGTAALPVTDPRLACRGFWWEKGVMRELVSKMPVKVILNADAGLLGAAVAAQEL